MHGDDFFISASQRDIEWLEAIMRANFEIKDPVIIGPEPGDQKVMSVGGSSGPRTATRCRGRLTTGTWTPFLRACG